MSGIKARLSTMMFLEFFVWGAWYTTVAASTIPTWEGTVSLPNGFLEAGASVTVPFGESLTAPVVYAGDIPAEGVSAADAAGYLFSHGLLI